MVWHLPFSKIKIVIVGDLYAGSHWDNVQSQISRL